MSTRGLPGVRLLVYSVHEDHNLTPQVSGGNSTENITEILLKYKLNYWV